MSTQELVLAKQEQAVAPILKNDELSNLQRLGNLLSASGYFSDAREMAQAAVKVMAGQELGIPPIAAMMGVNIIKGKVALGAHLIASRIRAHGYDFRIRKHDNEGCEIEFFSKPDSQGRRSSLGVTSFTKEDAVAAGVFSDMYKKYPRNMYYSRAVSNGAKWYTPEIFGGAPVYTPEELGAEIDGEGEMLHREPPPAPRQETVERRMEEIRQQQAAERLEGDHTPRHPPELLAIINGMRNAEACAEAIGRFKDALNGITGNDGDYYEVLGQHGFANRHDMKGKTAKAAKLLVVDLFNRWKKIESAVVSSEPIPGAGAWGAEELS